MTRDEMIAQVKVIIDRAYESGWNEGYTEGWEKGYIDCGHSRPDNPIVI